MLSHRLFNLDNKAPTITARVISNRRQTVNAQVL
jgi:hypothetical protein